MQRSSYAQRTWIDCDNGGAQNFNSLDSLLAVGYKTKDGLFDVGDINIIHWKCFWSSIFCCLSQDQRWSWSHKRWVNEQSCRTSSVIISETWIEEMEGERDVVEKNIITDLKKEKEKQHLIILCRLRWPYKKAMSLSEMVHWSYRLDWLEA